MGSGAGEDQKVQVEEAEGRSSGVHVIVSSFAVDAVTLPVSGAEREGNKQGCYLSFEGKYTPIKIKEHYTIEE